MARIEFSGSDDVVKLLNDLSRTTDDICKRAVFAGAGVLADALAEAVEKLPTEPFHPLPGAPNGGDPLNVVTPDDKEDIRNGLGISRIGSTGDGADVAVSFNGYTRHKEQTKKGGKFPNGVPIPMIVRSIESGSSSRKKNPFVRRAATAATEAIQRAEEETVHECLEVYQKTGRLPEYAGRQAGKGGKGTKKKHT